MHDNKRGQRVEKQSTVGMTVSGATSVALVTPESSYDSEER